MSTFGRARHFYLTFRRIGAETGSRRRALAYAGLMFRRKLGTLGWQIWAAATSPRRAAEVTALAESLGHGEPAIAIRISGGIGDYIVIARYMRDLLAQAPNAAFDIYCSRTVQADWIFAGVPGFRRAYHDILFDRYFGFYDVALRISQFVLVQMETVNWPKLRDHPWLVAAIDNLLVSRRDLEMVIQRHPYMDNYLASIAIFQNCTRQNFLHGMTKLAYGGDRLAVELDRSLVVAHGLADRPYVVVHNGFDTSFVITAPQATKCYPHFAGVIAGLRRALPELRFVQIGSSTSQAIAGVDLELIGETSLRQAAGLIAGAVLLLDNEGGLVHAAACLGTRSGVVFGPTPSRFFGYAGNVNIDPVFCGGCWWITETWMDLCARGFAEPRCMHEQPPDAVVARLLAALREVPALHEVIVRQAVERQAAE